MDLQHLRKPVSDTAPCGADLENNNDPRWGQLNTLAAGEKREGITQPPKWPDVRDLALELAAETRHLRLGVILTECATFIDGLPGLAEGLGLLRSWCENFWDHVYPAGEIEDQRDFRPPVIESLNYPSFLVRLKNVPVSQSAGGRFSIDAASRRHSGRWIGVHASVTVRGCPAIASPVPVAFSEETGYTASVGSMTRSRPVDANTQS